MHRAEKVGPNIQILSLKTVINVELGKSDTEKNISTVLKDLDRVITCSDNKKLSESIEPENSNAKYF